MSARRNLAGLVIVFVALTSGIAARCPAPGPQQAVVSLAGFVEPNTPGAVGVVANTKVQRIVGPSPDLNRVTAVRTFITKPGGAAPRAILIVIPGFLGGGGTFTPLAKQLVQAFNGNLEVWAVERRPNQLEDRRGALHAAAGTPQAIVEGAQFYFPETAAFDIDQDGIVDPPFLLPDALGGSTSFVKLAQNDVRFLAHWGIDTYARDWKLLVEAARAVVGPDGLVLFGGHSQGTSWTGAFAGYDFDPGSGIDPGYALVDGLVLLEGSGLGPASASPPDRTTYLSRVAALANTGGPNVYLANIFAILGVVDLGAAAEIAGVAGTFDPGAASILQRTSFGATVGLFIQTPATNRSVVGFFIDDDFSANPAFRASLGFSDDGTNDFNTALGAYVPRGSGPPRVWKDFDDPTLPVCGPFDDPFVSPGCAIIDNGPRPDPTDPPQVWGLEREVSDLGEFLLLTYDNVNFSEWYFVDGRVSLDFSYGRDSSSLGDESLLAITQTANIDVPVLCIGGSNGLTPTEASFASYLGSIATPAADQRIEIIEGYAHLDVITAVENETVPPLVDWINELLQRKLLGGL